MTELKQDGFAQPEAEASLAEVPLLGELDASPEPASVVRPLRDTFSAQEVAEFGVRVAPSLINWPTVVELRRQASAAITQEGAAEAVHTGRPVVLDDRLLLGRAVIRRVVADHVRTLHRDGADLWSRAQEEQYVEAVENAVFGYGRLQPLLELPDVENIEISGCDSVVVQFGDGRRERRPPVADSDAELIDAIRFLGQNGQPSRPFDDTHPTITLALGERFRLHAIGFGLSFRPSVVIRQHILTEVSLADLVAGGMLPQEVAGFLDAAVLARKSMVIAGDQGAGKTTLLRALIGSIPTTERFGTLETDYELMTHLQPGRENILALQSRVGHGETSGGTRVGEFTIGDLMPEALRQNLSRLIVGEVRGGEAAAMFEAMQAGTGTMSTTHSHSAGSTIDRLASRVAQGGVLTIDEAYRQVAHNIALFIYVTLVDDTWKGGSRRRYISEIRQATGALESGRPVTHLTYSANGTRTTQAGFTPDPDFEAELLPFTRALPERTPPGHPEHTVTAIAALTGLLLIGGLLAALAGWSRTWPERRPSRARSVADHWARLTRRPPGRAGRRRDLLLIGSVAVGLIVGLLSGWAVAIVVAPLLVLGLPYLLVLPKARDVELLEALDRWIRALAASMTTGRSVTDAIRISRRTAPPSLVVEVGRLVDRLNSRWDTSDALRNFADALDSPDADGVVAALILAARRGASGASLTLSALADSIQDQLKGRRAIETERAKPYVVVRQVTIISLVALGAMFVSSPGFFAGYATPIGQVILSVLVVLYLGSLILLRRKAQQPPRDRILVGGRG